MAEHHAIGRNIVEVEQVAEGAVVTARWGEQLTLATARRLTSLLERLTVEHGRIFLIIDHSEARPEIAEVRRYIMEWAREHRLPAIALFGASAVVRTFSRLILRAIVLIYRRPDLDERVTIVGTEAEAHAFVDKRRTQVGLRGKITGPICDPRE